MVTTSTLLAYICACTPTTVCHIFFLLQINIGYRNLKFVNELLLLLLYMYEVRVYAAAPIGHQTDTQTHSETACGSFYRVGNYCFGRLDEIDRGSIQLLLYHWILSSNDMYNNNNSHSNNNNNHIAVYWCCCCCCCHAKATFLQKYRTAKRYGFSSIGFFSLILHQTTLTIQCLFFSASLSSINDSFFFVRSLSLCSLPFLLAV